MLPVELYTLLAITAAGGKLITYSDLSKRMGVSPSILHKAVKKLTQAKLMTQPMGAQEKPHILMEQTIEFICYGAAYVIPVVEKGPMSLGIPTAAHAAPMSDILNVSDGSALVWPSIGGWMSGESIKPLHKRLPELALHDKPFYRIAAAFDSIRIGAARERGLARDFMTSEIPAIVLRNNL